MNCSKTRLAALVGMLCSPPLLAQPNILLIGIDGAAPRSLLAGLAQTKPDSAIPVNSREARALPTLQAMMRDMGASLSLNMTSTRAADGRYNTISGANWTSLLTGREYDVHGVSSNRETNAVRDGQTVREFENFRGTPLLTEELRARGYKTRLLAEWSPLNTVYGRYFDQREAVPLVWRDRNPDGTRGDLTPVTESNYQVGRQLAATDANFLYVHMDNVDYEGHSYGWDSASYARAMRQMDDKLTLILKGLMQRPNINAEEWLIAMTPDHGGDGGHGNAANPLVHKTFFMALHWDKGRWQVVRLKQDQSTIADVLPRLMKREVRLDGDVVLNTGAGTLDVDPFAMQREDSWVAKGGVRSTHALTRTGEGTVVVGHDTRFGHLEHLAGVTLLGARHQFDTLRLAGGTLVNLGELNAAQAEVASHLVNRGKFSGRLVLADGGKLSGDGLLSGELVVSSGATLAPGNSVGTTRVEGNTTLASGALYEVEIDGNGASDLLLGSGSIRVDGATLRTRLLGHGANLLAQPDTTVPRLPGRYTILTAQQGVSGEFAEVDMPGPFLDARVERSADSMSLVLARSATPFASASPSANGQAVGRAIESLGSTHAVHASLLALPTTAAARQALTQLDGQLYADLNASLVDDSRTLRDGLGLRLRHVDGSAIGQHGQQHGKQAWGQVIGHWKEAHGNDQARSYRSHTGGMLLGLDRELADGLRVGVAGGITRGTLTSEQRATASTDTYQLALYGSKPVEQLSLRAGVAHAWHTIRSNRAVAYDTQSASHGAGFGARSTQGFVEIARPLATAMGTLEPYANLAHVSLRRGGFSENGGASALQAPTQTTRSLQSTLGLRASTHWPLQGAKAVAVHAELGWLRELRSTRRSSTQMFRDSTQSFTVDSVQAMGHGILMKLRTEFDMSRHTSFSFGYAGLLAGQHRNHSADARLKIRF